MGKRRTWRKLHVGIDVNTQQIVSVALTGNHEDDAAVAGRMVEGKQDRLPSFCGDRAYDDFALREKLGQGVVQIIPPPKDAVGHAGTAKKHLKPYLGQRNQAVEDIRQQGRRVFDKEFKLMSVELSNSRTDFGA